MIFKNGNLRLSCLILFLGMFGVFCVPAQAQFLTGYDEETQGGGAVVASANRDADPFDGWRPALTDTDSAAESAPSASDAPMTSVVKEDPVEAQDPSLMQNRMDSSFSDAPVDLQADRLDHDSEREIVTASGDVMMVQAGRILRADKISYDLKKDVVTAQGHVVLNEESGDIHYAEKVRFSEKLKNGFVKGLKTYMADGSRFTAEKGIRENGTKVTMKDAAYTPCEPCKLNPEKPPLWQIRASEVTHDSEEKTISYKNARFEVGGVPVAYIPYFSHPDGSTKQKSGFLAPSGGYKSDLGAFAESRYYMAIAPDMDATAGLRAMTKQAPLLTGEWRKRWESAFLNLGLGGTYAERTDIRNGVELRREEEFRGHLTAEGLWEISDKWRAGVNSQLATDDQYMRQYDFSDDDVLETDVYAERFSGRDYAVARVMNFQDVRVRDEREDQPQVLPEVIASFKGDPNSVPVLGGRWGVDASLLGLERYGDDQDMNRMSLAGSWNRRFVSDYGLLTTVDATARGDLYSTRDRNAAFAGSGQSNTVTEGRFFPVFQAQSSYPLVNEFEDFQATVAPVVALTMATNVDVNNNIPNEDSQDAQIDTANLFDINRFPGLDRVEDKSRVTYGLRSGLYSHAGGHIEAFAGQSYRFDRDDSPFLTGSGLVEQESDIVGQLSALHPDGHYLDYRFQLGADKLSSQRHELTGLLDFNRFRLSSRYFYGREFEGTDIAGDRQQIQAAAAYNLTDTWRVRAGGTHDFAENQGLRKAFAGLDYVGQCLSWSVTGERNISEDFTGESDFEVFFRIGLKNLGQFAPSDWRTRSELEDD